MRGLALVLLLSCSPKVEQRAAVAAEVTTYALELAACRTAAKADGGMPVYEECALEADHRHGVNLDGGTK